MVPEEEEGKALKVDDVNVNAEDELYASDSMDELIDVAFD